MDLQEQAEKARAFRALHQRDRAFVTPNPWDVASARVLEALGFAALATTSSGFAISMGQNDGEPGRDAILEHAATLVRATTLPITADLENGFGDRPEDVADTIRAAAAAGLVGGSIEDFTGRPQDPLYELSYAKERVAAAVEAARRLDFPFTLTARAENFFRGRPDLADTIRRLQAYQEAGADVLFAPSLRSREDIAAVLREVNRPLQVLAGSRRLGLSVGELSTMGVRRISVGGLLCRVAYGALIQGAREIREKGTFAFAEEAARARDLDSLLKLPAAAKSRS
jgi:2-methylisocitrate lyase-like PEP mutase family enzyme